MSSMQLTQPPKSTTAMLVRKPAADVFEAIVDPRITSQFWFTRGAGRLETGIRLNLTADAHPPTSREPADGAIACASRIAGRDHERARV